MTSKTQAADAARPAEANETRAGAAASLADGASPDTASLGLLRSAPPPLRYGGDHDPPRQSPEDGEVGAIMRRMTLCGVRVLDVGSGTGAHILGINQGKGNAIVCIEPDPRRAEAARARGLKVEEGVYDLAMAERLGLFDVIVLSDILEHLQSPGAMLEIAKTSLRPGGVVLASTPNVAHWSVRLNLLLGRFDYAEDGIMDATHLRWFTEKTLRRLFERQGFVVEELDHSLGVWLPAYEALIPFRLRTKILSALMPLAPRLLGCQHVLRARLSPGPASVAP